MKRILALLFMMSVTTTLPIRAVEPAATPESCIGDFYRWCVTNLVANREPMKQRAEIRRFERGHRVDVVC